MAKEKVKHMTGGTRIGFRSRWSRLVVGWNSLSDSLRQDGGEALQFLERCLSRKADPVSGGRRAALQARNDRKVGEGLRDRKDKRRQRRCGASRACSKVGAVGRSSKGVSTQLSLQGSPGKKDVF